MVEKLLGSNFLPFSTPIDDDWIVTLREFSVVYIVGNGVTSAEYVRILSRCGFKFKVISPSEAINNIDKLSDGYVIVACHYDYHAVIEALNNPSLVVKVHYGTFRKLLRNRAVIDFRGGLDSDPESFIDIFNKLKDFKTIAGVDVFISSKDFELFSNEFLFLLSEFSAFFHFKVSVEVESGFPFDDYTVPGFAALEIVVRQQCASLFNKDVLESAITKGFIKDVHVVFVDCPEEKSSFFSSEVQVEHPKYYDELLFPEEKSSYSVGNCLSRRMFPIFDKDYKLKLCSLYGELARTSFALDDVFSSGFVENRNALCLICKESGVYRIK